MFILGTYKNASKLHVGTRHTVIRKCIRYFNLSSVHLKQTLSELNDTSAKHVRQSFLDFFVNNHGHNFVRSSSVIPHNDPTLAFVNAGMNQFKQIFLGNSNTSLKRAANSQKCIRVGGKHNDLDDVARDSYHHTFFEMLGSWSFNDYFKEEACSMAWQLLTDIYRIPPEKLFVTYFAGSEKLNLEADDECKEIWRKLGVKSEHILPFGTKENFWEMGSVGPCGPCTEIHVNKGNWSPGEASSLVNKGIEDVVEIWNLVFIQYNRLGDSMLVPLPARHVDTGMGLERLVAYLQNKSSNYDTDLFMPLINAVHKISGGNRYTSCYDLTTAEGQRDYGYRLLADHSRMITVALADGAFTDSNHRLRRVVRQAIITSQQTFNQSANLLIDLTCHVAESLGDVYPEIQRNLENVHTLIRFEEDVLKSLISKSAADWKKIIVKYPALSTMRLEEHPGLVAGLRELDNWLGSSKASAIPGSVAFKLYETFGLNEEALEQLAAAKNLKINWDEYKMQLENTRKKSQQITSSQLQESRTKDGVLNLDKIPLTDTSSRYAYTRATDTKYTFPEVRGKILLLCTLDGETTRVETDQSFTVVFDRTNMYSEAGGQVGDRGILKSATGVAEVLEAKEIEGRVCHQAVVRQGYFSTNDPVVLVVDEERKLNCMANHTATHLLQSALKSVLRVTCQKSSHVSANSLKFDFGLFSADFDADQVSRVESAVRDAISKNLAVKRDLMKLEDAVQNSDLTLLPGEVYPEEVSVISIEGEGFTSFEPCCGTHVLNTGDIEDFCIVSLKSSGVGSRSIKALTRSAARNARRAAEELLSEAISLRDKVSGIQSLPGRFSEISEQWIDHIKEFEGSLLNLRKEVADRELPYVQSKETIAVCDKTESLLRAAAQEALAQFMRHRMETAIEKAAEKSQNFVVQKIDPPENLLKIGGAKLSLIKATRCCQDKPVLILAEEDGCITGRCTVPQNFVTEDFNAAKWASSLSGRYSAKGSAPKGQNPETVFNIRSARIPAQERRQALEDVENIAINYAEKHCQRKN